MPHTTLMPTYEVVLTSNEFRLITMALAGILKDSDDIDAAKKLNAHLCHQRKQQLNQSLEIASKANDLAQELSKKEEEQIP